MKQPTLGEFGLRPDDTKRAADAKKALVAGAVVCGIAGLAGIAFLKDYNGYYKDALIWLGLLVGPPYGPFIVYFLFKALLRGLWPKFRQAMRYASAREAYEKWWLRTQTQFWKSLSGIQFEHELAALFRRIGTQAAVTRASDDKGVDIWLDRKGQRVPVQCKAHKNPVGPAAVREFFGTMQHFGSKEGILASLSGFTRGVYEYARGKPIKLLTMQDIVQMQRQVR